MATGWYSSRHVCHFPWETNLMAELFGGLIFGKRPLFQTLDYLTAQCTAYSLSKWNSWPTELSNSRQHDPSYPAGKRIDLVILIAQISDKGGLYEVPLSWDNLSKIRGIRLRQRHIFEVGLEALIETGLSTCVLDSI